MNPGGWVNEAAAAHLLNRFRRPLMAIARRNSRCDADAEDAFARTLELALRSCPIEDDVDGVEAWATVTCRRESWKISRRYNRKPTASLEGLRARAGLPWLEAALSDRHDHSPEERALDAERVRELYQAIAELPEGQRAVVVLNARGWSGREIVPMVGRSQRRVRRAIHHGKRALRERLEASR